MSHELRHVHGALDGPEGEGRLFHAVGGPAVAVAEERVRKAITPGASGGPGGREPIAEKESLVIGA